MIKKLFTLTLLISTFLSLTISAQNPPAPTRVRGNIEKNGYGLDRV